MFCRYGLAYVLHRLPAVANIIMTSEYLHFTQQIMASHDRANKQAEMDVSPEGNADRDAGLLEAALWQLCNRESRGCGSVDCLNDGSNEHQPKSEHL